MAYCVNKYCDKCQQIRMHTNDKCNFCMACEQTVKDKEFLDLPIQTQILKLKERIEQLENRGRRLN